MDDLSNAYKTSSKDVFPESSRISEKHATNRQLRFKLWQNFLKEYGRKPNNLEEFDEYINNYDPVQLDIELKYINGYGYDYFNNLDDISKVKKALIRVAQNQKIKNNIKYVKQGGLIKK